MFHGADPGLKSARTRIEEQTLPNEAFGRQRKALDPKISERLGEPSAPAIIIDLRREIDGGEENPEQGMPLFNGTERRGCEIGMHQN